MGLLDGSSCLYVHLPLAVLTCALSLMCSALVFDLHACAVLCCGACLPPARLQAVFDLLDIPLVHGWLVDPQVRRLPAPLPACPLACLPRV